MLARVTPDGKYLVYWSTSQRTRVFRIFRVAVDGGTQQIVMDAPGFSNLARTLPPSNVCLRGQMDTAGKKLTFTSFDPLRGDPHPELTSDVHSGTLLNWMPSPDGSRIALAEFHPLEGGIRLPSLKGQAERAISIKDWAAINSDDWRLTGNPCSFPPKLPPALLCFVWTCRDVPLRSGIRAAVSVPTPSLLRMAATCHRRHDQQQ